MIRGFFDVLAEVWQDRAGRVGFVLVAFILLLALAGPLISVDPNKINVVERFEPPSITHPLGTDNLGRDLFSRTAQGTRSALIISLAVVGASLLLGSIIGVGAGLIGGVVDRFMLGGV